MRNVENKMSQDLIPYN